MLNFCRHCSPCTKSLLQSLERTLHDSDCEKAPYNFNALHTTTTTNTNTNITTTTTTNNNNNNNNNNNYIEVPFPAKVDND